MDFTIFLPLPDFKTHCLLYNLKPLINAKAT